MGANVAMWRKNACQIIWTVADEKFQRDNWFGKGKYVSSPSEMHNNVFDDLAIEEFLASSEIGLNDLQRAAGDRFVDAMNAFDKPMDSLTPEQILDHPMWREVRRTAKAFLDLLECEKHE
jgi:hypothetical protein